MRSSLDGVNPRHATRSRYRMPRPTRNQFPPSRVVVHAVLGVLDDAGAHGPRDLLDPVPDALRGAESPLPLDPVEANPIGSPVLLLQFDRDAHARHVRLQLLLEVAQLIVLEIVA